MCAPQRADWYHMKLVDLHVHSTRSDGTLTPTELVDYAIEKKLTAFALTDHDTVDGLEEAISYGKTLLSQGITVPEIIPGIEFSSQYLNKDIHILGLYIDYKSTAFQTHLKAFTDSRITRNHKMCTKLQEKGIDITYEKLLKAFPGAVITRAHYAQYLLTHRYVNSINEAFERYVGDHSSCFVPREKVTPGQAVRLILEADGIPILAHPILYGLSNSRLDTLVAELKEEGLLGIEAIYPNYSMSEERQIRSLAYKYHLLISGGSDFHGDIKPGLDLGSGYGKLRVPEEVLLKLKKSRMNLLFSDMDGTLLNDNCNISPTLKTALDEMTNKGHHLILSSGRPLPSILNVRETLRLTYPNMLVISNNGALVHDCDKKADILTHHLDLKDIRFIIEEAQKINLHIHAYTDNEIVCHEMNEEIAHYTRRIHLPIKYADDIPSALDKGSFKLLAIHLTDKSRLEAFRDHLVPYCKERIQFFFSNDQYLEILPSSAGKGNALHFVRDYLHAPISHTFAAGDAENDISMLEAAGTAIAMNNASDAVKAKADIITLNDNNHDGLLEVLDAYF